MGAPLAPLTSNPCNAVRHTCIPSGAPGFQAGERGVIGCGLFDVTGVHGWKMGRGEQEGWRNGGSVRMRSPMLQPMASQFISRPFHLVVCFHVRRANVNPKQDVRPRTGEDSMYGAAKTKLQIANYHELPSCPATGHTHAQVLD